MEPARIASSMGIVLNACEISTNFADEVEFVWAKLNQMTPTKWFYLYSRYFIIVVYLQIYHYGTRYVHLDPSKPAPPGMCAWVLYKFFFWQTLVYGTDLILCKRVYSLYNRSESILYFLYSMLISKTLLVAFTSYFIYASLGVQTPLGRDTVTLKVAVQYLSGEILMQIILVALAFSRVIRQGPLHILTLVTETGAESCICIIVMVLAVLVYSFGYEISFFAYPTCTGILSTICCRLILNTHRSQRIR